MHAAHGFSLLSVSWQASERHQKDQHSNWPQKDHHQHSNWPQEDHRQHSNWPQKDHRPPA